MPEKLPAQEGFQTRRRDYSGDQPSRVPQIKGRTALLLILALLVFLAVFTYVLTTISMTRRLTDVLESVLFLIAALVGSLRIYYLRRR